MSALIVLKHNVICAAPATWIEASLIRGLDGTNINKKVITLLDQSQFYLVQHYVPIVII